MLIEVPPTLTHSQLDIRTMTNHDHSVTHFVEQLRFGNEQSRDVAAQKIWEKYVTQLAALARKRLSERLRRRQDEEDILQSMYKSFCNWQASASSGPTNRDELFSLLVRITMNKIANAAKRERAAKRDYRRETRIPEDGENRDLRQQLVSREPTPEEAVALVDECQTLLQSLPDDLRCVALWKLEGCTNPEIAERLGRTTRTVELKLQRIRRHWKPVEDARDNCDEERLHS